MQSTPHPTGSHYVNRDIARRAVELASPMIEAVLGDRGIIGSGFLYVVIMNPALPPSQAAFDDAVLYEHAFGDRTRWDADYAAFARAEARVSWTTGMDGHRVQSQEPHLLREGDFLVWGGVSLDGIVVAASGAFPWYDELFAGTVAMALRALAKAGREAEVAGGAMVAGAMERAPGR